MKIISISVSIFKVAIKVIVFPEPGGPHSKKMLTDMEMIFINFSSST
jgi:hypothetical protein